MRYCTHCGKEINEDAVICINCGCKVDANFNKANNDKILIDTVINRLNINSIIWIIIAIIQVFIGLSKNWWVLIVGILNIISALVDINFCKNYQVSHKGLLDKVKPLVGTIIVLIYNLVIGGVIGVCGSIYYLVVVRQYVIENEKDFLRIEKYSSNE